jgi:hypothetical protein
VYERRIDIVTREWRDNSGPLSAPGAKFKFIYYVGFFLAWLASHIAFGLGVFVFGASLLAAFALLVRERHVSRPRKLRTRPARVKLTHEGIDVEDDGFIPADLVASAYVQPNGDTRPLVVARGHDGRSIFQAFADDENDAARMLTAMGWDPERRRASFLAVSPLVTSLLGGLLPVAIATLLTVLVVSLAWHAQPIVRLLLGGASFLTGAAYLMGPQRVEVGADGMLITWRGRRRYVGFADISSIERTGSEVLVKQTDDELKLMFSDDEARVAEALVYRLRRAKENASGAPSPTATRLSRGGQSLEEWYASLRRLSDISYREAGVADDELWQIVHDPAANEDARAGAALLLRARPEAQPRLRVAAESAASPCLRVALEAAADPEVEEEKILDHFAS